MVKEAPTKVERRKLNNVSENPGVKRHVVVGRAKHWGFPFVVLLLVCGGGRVDSVGRVDLTDPIVDSLTRFHARDYRKFSKKKTKDSLKTI